MKPLILALASSLALGQTANAMLLDWNGQYRFEYVEVDKTELQSGSRKGYLLNNLVLMPHIIPSDGFEVISKIHLTENSDLRYSQSQMGMIWGNSANPCPNGTSCSTYFDNSNSFADQRPKTALAVSQLYLKVNHEWGTLLVGRAPMQFGLGITHNSGADPFSHWYDTRDLLAYKIFFENTFIMPAISKQYAGDFQLGNEITNQSLQVEYKNHDTGDWLGVFYETSKGNSIANDTPVNQGLAGVSVQGPLNINSYNVVFGKDFTQFNFRIEGGFHSGSTGTTDLNGRDVRLNSYAVISEINVHPESSNNRWNIKFGSVSGDNPDTEDFEGYLVDRNYDVALLLFNHSLGQNTDIFKTKIGHNPAFTNPRNSLDDEYMSNVIFFAPRWINKLNDRWEMQNTLLMARLNNSRTMVGTTVESISSDVGFEWDLGFNYKANDNMEWRFNSGLLLPGKAFELGSANISNTNSVFGFSTSAAITF